MFTKLILKILSPRQGLIIYSPVSPVACRVNQAGLKFAKVCSSLLLEAGMRHHAWLFSLLSFTGGLSAPRLLFCCK